SSPAGSPGTGGSGARAQTYRCWPPRRAGRRRGSPPTATTQAPRTSQPTQTPASPSGSTTAPAPTCEAWSPPSPTPARRPRRTAAASQELAATPRGAGALRRAHVEHKRALARAAKQGHASPRRSHCPTAPRSTRHCRRGRRGLVALLLCRPSRSLGRRPTHLRKGREATAGTPTGLTATPALALWHE